MDAGEVNICYDREEKHFKKVTYKKRKNRKSGDKKRKIKKFYTV